MTSSLHYVLHVLCVLALPPLLLGVINRTKAIFSGRRGQPLLQPYFDIAKLLRKDVVLSPTTTGIFLVGPVVAAATALTAALIVPLGHESAPLSFRGDFILLAYLLALGRFFTMTAALDVGSSFEGMGAAREATYACCAEPVLFFGFLALARMSDAWNSADMLTSHWTTHHLGAPAVLLIVVSWGLVLLVENCRIPFDDPNTHLELTMIHEVMVLDHSGPAFGLILYAAAMKLLVFSTLVVRLIVPLHNDTVPAGWDPIPWTILNWVAYLVAILGLATLVGTVESVMGRVRMQLIPNWLIGAGVLAAFSLVLVLVR